MTKAANLAALGSVVEVPTGSAPSFQCRAWVNFNGTGTVAIRASGNVSSITDVNSGRYYVNLTTAMPDTNYAAQLSYGGAGMDDMAGACLINSASQVYVGTSDQGGADNTFFDATYVFVNVFR